MHDSMIFHDIKQITLFVKFHLNYNRYSLWIIQGRGLFIKIADRINIIPTSIWIWGNGGSDIKKI